MRRSLATLLLALLLQSCGTTMPALAQHNHSHGHGDYKSWASGKTENCCDDRDCGSLKDDEWRESAAGTEVKIEGQWCPVQREHWLKRGKSPDWNKAHACIVPRRPLCDEDGCHDDTRSPCDLLLCFSGKGGV